MRLQALTGNDALKRSLELQTERRGLSHAYIISGPKGSGRHTLAGILAAALVCSAPDGDVPCGLCSGCRKAAGGIHPDIIQIVGEDGKEINVAQIRAMRSDAYIRPNEAARKVYLLEEADRMKDSAQNAMLKVLEDGPPYAAFLLLAENAQLLLTTVRSRCEVLTLSPVSLAEAEGFLRAHFPDRAPEELQTAARRCEGLLGRAVEELDGADDIDEKVRQTALALAGTLARGDELALCAFCAGLEQDKKADKNKDGWDWTRFSALMAETVRLLRDALVQGVHAGADQDPERRQAAAALAAALPPRSLLAAVEIMDRLREACAHNTGVGHLTGWLCAELAALPRRQGLPSVPFPV
ncbi:ATP-binding protein [Pseudoflavonifractor sp. MSJ-37]|uniref:DNA polymerase III subunit n=1 Tax=Pseudoflavonifractor sp. MSJ-37 TaxID=2841531 RepID=UPI001C0FBC6B|nr:DNA polymerase III subunit delta [Pseudoflavonifractor sp. MSJ-37]MBU5435387.1 DNA polymerase III subunit delta [Pseudoflavonifractor sp. MSJ-37]